MGNLSKLFAISAASGAIILGGSAVASALGEIHESTPSRISTPAAPTNDIEVGPFSKNLGSADASQSLPVKIHTDGSAGGLGWDRTTPGRVEVHQALPTINVGPVSISHNTVPSVTAGLPAAADTALSTDGGRASVSTASASAQAGATTAGASGSSLASVKASFNSWDTGAHVSRG